MAILVRLDSKDPAMAIAISTPPVVRLVMVGLFMIVPMRNQDEMEVQHRTGARLKMTPELASGMYLT